MSRVRGAGSPARAARRNTGRLRGDSRNWHGPCSSEGNARRTRMNKATLLVLVGLTLGPGLVHARPPHHGPGMPGMAARCQEMMAGMKSMDARLDEKLAAVNAAQGEAKVDAM